MTLIAALAIATSRPSFVEKRPPWLDDMLAGYALLNDGTHSDVGVFDPAKKFYLVRYGECDGAYLTMVLTADRKVVSDIGYFIPNYIGGETEGSLKLKQKALPSLSTGKGVRIGDSPERLQQVLGKPNHTQKTGNRNQFREYVYTTKLKERRHGENWVIEYTANYVFKNGKLIEIRFGRYFDM